MSRSAVLPQAGGGRSPGGLPHDIRGLLPYSWPWWEYALWGLLVAAVLALVGFGGWYFYRKWRARRDLAITNEDPWEIFGRRLTALRPPMPFSGSEQEEFFFQLSLLVREVIELRTKVPATDRTYQELREPLRRKLPLSTEEVEAVLAFLERADLVKFAGAPSSVAEAEAALSRVGRWLQKLRPRGIDQVAATSVAKGGSLAAR